MARDYYDILGVPKSANEDEIKKAFRKQAHQHHPDKAGGDEAKFKELNEAYQVLSSPEKRKQYDQYGQTFEQAQANGQAPGGGGPFGGFDFGSAGINVDDLGDMFGDVFGFGGGRGRSRRAPQSGNDVAVDVTIEFSEAAFGAERMLNLQLPRPCDVCKGSGSETGELKTCPTCSGKGVIREARQTILGVMQTEAACSTCHGSGSVPTKACTHCHGTGVRKQLTELSVKIPAGIDDGQSIRLSGQGEFAQGGAGDLFVRVHVRPHPTLTREAFAVRSTVEVGPSQAALGATVPLETLDGQTHLKIPAGIQSGAIIHLRGKGITHLRDHGRGDHLITVVVTTPKKLSGKAKKLYRELGDELGETL